MCRAVSTSTVQAYSLDDLITAGILTPEQAEVGRDAEFGLDVCFCVSNPEAAFRAAGIPFVVDDIGDIVIGPP